MADAWGNDPDRTTRKEEFEKPWWVTQWAHLTPPDEN
jgi:hypothetical protein